MSDVTSFTNVNAMAESGAAADPERCDTAIHKE